jgi:hypothetical protein
MSPQKEEQLLALCALHGEVSLTNEKFAIRQEESFMRVA